MKLQFRDYRDIDEFQFDKDNNFNTDSAVCKSDWNDADSIEILSPLSSGKFTIRGNEDSWTVGCQNIFAIINDERELIFLATDINSYRYDAKDRLIQAHADLTNLKDRGWQVCTEEELDNKEFIDGYMPDVF